MSNIILTRESSTDVTLSRDVNEIVITKDQPADISINNECNEIVITPQQSSEISLNNESSEIVFNREYNQITLTISDSPSQSILSWIDVAGDVEYTGVETVILEGEVSECLYKDSTIYRFESFAESANGYSVEDSFYREFDGVNLTNLIVKRNG
ncbi:MAG: hypothetical protein HRU26_16600 [Psychroserpens sp.]|nr:hypothetical protein [Psychroserpens sp.]